MGTGPTRIRSSFDRVASLLGLLAKATTAVIAAVERLHGAIADATPAPVSEGW